MKKHIIQFTLFCSIAVLLAACGGNGDIISGIDLYPVSTKDGFQYINKKGEVIIPGKFKNAGLFHDGIALVNDSTGYRYINKKGENAFAGTYKNATPFNDGLAWVVQANKAPDLIDKNGKVLFTFKDAQDVYMFNEGLALFSKETADGKTLYGFVDKKGNVAIQPQFKKAENFSNGLAAVQNDDYKCGFIDKTGKIVINYQFSEVMAFTSNGLCVVEFDKKYGVIDKAGKYIINPQYDLMFADGDNFIVRKDKQYGYINKKGEYQINPQFNHMLPFNGNNMAPALIGEKWGFVDKTGKIVVNPQFDFLCPLIDDIAIAVLSEKIGFINKKGEYVMNPQYEGVSSELIQSFINEGSRYNRFVTNDFFDNGFVAQSLVPVLKDLANKYLGHTMGTIQPVFSFDTSKFSGYSNRHLLQEKQITKDVTMRIYAEGNIFKSVKSGWFTNKEYDSNSIVLDFVCEISCSGKAWDKTNDIFYTLLEQCNKLNKDEAKAINPGQGTNLAIFNDAGGNEAYISAKGNTIRVNIQAYID